MTSEPPHATTTANSSKTAVREHIRPHPNLPPEGEGNIEERPHPNPPPEGEGNIEERPRLNPLPLRGRVRVGVKVLGINPRSVVDGTDLPALHADGLPGDGAGAVGHQEQD